MRTLFYMLTSILAISAIVFFYLPLFKEQRERHQSEKKDLQNQIFCLQQNRDSLLYFRLTERFERIMYNYENKFINNCPSVEMFSEYDSLKKIYSERHYTFKLSTKDYSICR